MPEVAEANRPWFLVILHEIGVLGKHVLPERLFGSTGDLTGTGGHDSEKVEGRVYTEEQIINDKQLKERLGATHPSRGTT